MLIALAKNLIFQVNTNSRWNLFDEVKRLISFTFGHIFWHTWFARAAAEFTELLHRVHSVSLGSLAADAVLVVLTILAYVLAVYVQKKRIF